MQLLMKRNSEGMVPLATTSAQHPFAYFVVNANSARAVGACISKGVFIGVLHIAMQGKLVHFNPAMHTHNSTAADIQPP